MRSLIPTWFEWACLAACISMTAAVVILVGERAPTAADVSRQQLLANACDAHGRERQIKVTMVGGACYERRGIIVVPAGLAKQQHQ